MRRVAVVSFVAMALVGTAVAVSSTKGDGAPEVSYARDVQPIFDRNCVSCHPSAYPYLDLRRGRAYADLVRVSAATRPSFERVVPGKPQFSYLLTHPPDPSLRGLLTNDDRATISAWIRAGAKDD